MAEKKVQPKHPKEEDKKAAGSRKAAEKTTARKVATRKVARKASTRKQARKQARKF